LRPVAAPPWPDATSVQPSAGERRPLPTEVAEVLASGRPVAYFALGTVKNADSADFRTGLRALAGYDGVVVATTGRPLDPHELGAIPANTVVAEFLPQASVLERADLLVSHCGSGTMLGGLVHGVPQVALPRGTDQPDNAALLARAGAGIVVAPESYAVGSIAAAVSAVTQDPAFRTAAERVRDEIAAMPDADAACAGLAF
jgi:MGT family glycosyltransferase